MWSNVTSINERTEWATGPDYDEINDAIELLLSVVVSVEDQLPMGGGETVSAIQGVLSSILEFRDVNTSPFDWFGSDMMLLLMAAYGSTW